MPETTENYHRIPVSSGHSDHSIKTITVSASKGIKALYCTDCKEIITYLFDVDKWTMDEAKEWVENHKKEFEDWSELAITKGVIPFHSYPKASDGTAWDGPGEVSKAEVSDLKKMCTWYDSGNPDVKSSYKLPHHKADGYATVWNGVKAAMSRLYQSNTKIPDSDRKACYNHLARHYKEFSKEPPEWGKEYSNDELQVLFGDGDMRNLDRRTKDFIGSQVRYKSYGTFLPKGVEDGSSDELYVRGFFTDDKEDVVGDIITKEATDEAIERWRKWGNIRTMHDYPSGRAVKIGETDGLDWNEIVTVPVDKNTRELIEGGVLKAYSVGIIPRKYELNQAAIEAAGEDADPWFFPLIIHSYDMVEISYVDHPANYAATIQEIGSQKFKEMSHRTVIFKNNEVMGDIDDMDEMEKNAIEQEELDSDDEVLDSVEQQDADLESEIEEEVAGEDEVVEADPEPETDKDEVDEEDEVVEKEEDETFDVALAVGDIKGSISGLEERVTHLAESLDSLVDRVVERLLDAMTASSEEQANVAEEEINETKQFDSDAFVEKITEKVLSGLADILVPEAARTAKVYVDSDGNEVTPETSEQKTKRYLEMTPSQRRTRMKEVLENTFNK